MKKIVATSILQVFCIGFTVLFILAESLGGAIGMGVCTLLCIPTIIRYSIEYGEKKMLKKFDDIAQSLDSKKSK
ncbi:MAG: hypothetical protein MJY80_06945 [Bacteroidales bacterium]|jgi:Flp pilus assembly protein TadB|nr:hypothetical protein [Bacteroidales bacterium]